MISSVQSPSFKAYVPVEFYAKNPRNGEYVPVLKKENIKKCQNFVVRNLNHSKMKTPNEKFVNFYKTYDSDYARNQVVQSVYDPQSPLVYLVTGSDVDKVKEMAKPIGKAKAEAIDLTGRSSSFEVFQAGKNYFDDVMRFIKRSCRRVKSTQGEPLSLRMYFDPKYGPRNGKLQGFEFVNARFIKSE